MTTEIITWFRDVIMAEVDGLREVETFLDKNSAPDSHNAWQLRIGDGQSEDRESNRHLISDDIHIEVKFSFITKDYAQYLTALETFYSVRKRLMGENAGLNPYVTEDSNFIISGFKNVTYTGLNEPVDGGTYIMPVLEFDLICKESN